MITHLRTSSRRRPALAAFAVAAVGALGLTACGAGDPDGRAATAGPASSAQSTATATTTEDGGVLTSADAGVTPLGSADTAMKTLRPAAPSQLVVTQVRVSSHEGFDRAVFEMTGQGSPGWFIDYTDRPTQQGSGSSVDYQGAIALNVNIDGTTYPFDLGMEDPGLSRVAGSGHITEVIPAATFEGRSQFIIGLDGRLPYAVQVLEDPPRVVVDVLKG